eukprot:645505-Prymnesium_polylepis.2
MHAPYPLAQLAHITTTLHGVHGPSGTLTRELVDRRFREPSKLEVRQSILHDHRLVAESGRLRRRQADAARRVVDVEMNLVAHRQDPGDRVVSGPRFEP